MENTRVYKMFVTWLTFDGLLKNKAHGPGIMVLTM